MEIYVECPNCGDMVEIVQINCGIFRHAVLKKNNQQINPHTPKHICDQLHKNGLVYGCAKPFRLEKINDKFVAYKCGYI